jgi:phenylalanyl-tRNA synthetase beta chain
VVGVARELAAALGAPFRAPAVPRSAPGGEAAGLTRVALEAPDLCPRYAARIVRNVRNRPSPPWMQARLEAAGMRPISGIVDVTNYVMLELGQPLHAFDYDTLEERRIVVRRARPGETITTLDGQTRALDEQMLVIADARRAVAVAGVMGGADTEMTEATTTMLLESAHFNPVSIRRTSRGLGLRTEASYRFERTVDPGGVATAADRACQWIAEIGLGEPAEGIVDVECEGPAQRIVEIRPARASLLLGYPVRADEVVDALTRLGFEPADEEPSPKDHALPFRVPSWRPDIVREVDLVEEVGRVLGYERIPERLPRGATLQGRDTPSSLFEGGLRSVLVAAGLQEAVCGSLIAPSALEDPRTDGGRIAIRSALSSELSGLRRSLLPGLVETMERNARRHLSPLAFFEIGKVFHAGEDGPVESASVAAALSGAPAACGWDRQDRPHPADFHTAVGLVERIAEELHVQDVRTAPCDAPILHPGRRATVLLDGAPAGFVGELHPDRARGLNIRDRIVVFELAVDALRTAASARRRFQPLSDMPAIVRDLAPRVARSLPYARVREAIESAQVDFLESVALTDVYTGSPIPDDLKALTLSFTFRASDRTLTEAEASEALAAIRDRLAQLCSAQFVG